MELECIYVLSCLYVLVKNLTLSIKFESYDKATSYLARVLNQ